MDAIKIYPNSENWATIICPNCGKERSIDASKFVEQFKPVKVKCSCGHSFLVSFEKRKFYRKVVKIPGTCKKVISPGTSQQIFVEDVSRTGLRISFTSPHGLQPGDIVKIEFSLDDANQSPVILSAEVKRFTETWVGVEYCDSNIPKSLAFYLMP